MFAEFDKVVRCLALELPEAVHADVVTKYGKLKAEVEKITSTNNAKDAIIVLRDIVAAADSGSLCPTSISVRCAREILQQAPVA